MGLRTGGEPTGPAFIYYAEYYRARYIEIYLFGQPPKCSLAAYEFEVMDLPTEEPVMNTRQLEELLANSVNTFEPARKNRIGERVQKKWWQFWKG